MRFRGMDRPMKVSSCGITLIKSAADQPFYFSCRVIHNDLANARSGRNLMPDPLA